MHGEQQPDRQRCLPVSKPFKYDPRHGPAERRSASAQEALSLDYGVPFSRYRATKTTSTASATYTQKRS